MREVMAATAGAAIMVVGLSGCSSNDPSETDTKPTTKVAIGDEELSMGDSVTCGEREGATVITMGDPDHGVIATVTSADSPEVLSVVFGDVDHKQYMYVQDMPAGTPPDATVIKDGELYKISGTASELRDIENPESKPFEIEVRCE